MQHFRTFSRAIRNGSGISYSAETTNKRIECFVAEWHYARAAMTSVAHGLSRAVLVSVGAEMSNSDRSDPVRWRSGQAQ